MRNARLILISLCLAIGTSTANAATVILNDANSFVFDVESGATISQPGGPDGFNPPGEGAILGTNLLFALGPASSADFSLSDTVLGRRLAGDNPAFFVRPRDVIALDIQLAILVGSSGNIYSLDMLSWVLDRGTCVGLCDAAGGRTSFAIELVSAVPLPAALPLLGAGLAGLGAVGWIRRRRQQAAV